MHRDFHVLLIEDNAGHAGQLMETLNEMERVYVSWARDRASARNLISEHRSKFDLVILDAALDPPGLSLDTLDLIDQLFVRNETPSFDGLLVASSGIAEYRKEMLLAGCHRATTQTRIFVELEEILSDALERQITREFPRIP
jgi:DNA-binding response OmpR family regulator